MLKKYKTNKEIVVLKAKLKKEKAKVQMWKWNYKQISMDRDDWRKKFIKLKKYA
jgi:hypothetical protein